MKPKQFLAGLFTVVLAFTIISCGNNKLKIISVSVDYKENPAGIGLTGFNFGWKLNSPERCTEQTAYRILVSAESALPDDSEKLIWDSGETESCRSILIPYGGPKLAPGTTYFWKVKIRDNHANESEWSKTGQFTTGLFLESDWSGARWIALDTLDPAKRIVPGIHLPGKDYKGKDLGFHKLPLFRKDFVVAKRLKKALVFVSGLGQYELTLNGKKVGDHFLAPGWADYEEEIFYNTYDITAQLSRGKNTFGCSLGNGFYIVPNNRYRKVMTAYGNPAMILKLQLDYDDGSSEIVVSDETWKTHPSPTVYSSIYGGETYDATLEQDGWDSPGFDDSGWQNVILARTPGKSLRPENDYPVKIEKKFEPKNIVATDSLPNTWMYDFGQNYSGIAEISVKGKRGDTIRLIPAELVGKGNLANQKATGSPYYFTYILKGGGVETWSPKFTYYGFRYVQVEGAVPVQEKVKPDLPVIIKMKQLHIRNSSPEAGRFSSSFGLFNRIDTLIKRAIESNLQSVVTDCPHREKLGWLEQTYLMGEGIRFNFDIYNLYKKQVDDMIAAQTPDGLVPDIAPEYVEFSGGFRDSPEWGSAAVILPWLVYKWYGDTAPMEKAWDMMGRYVAYLKSKSEGHILSYGLGDWFDLGPERPGVAQLTPVALTATAIYYYDVKLLSQMALLLGKNDDAQNYAAWANEIRNAFNAAFFNPETKIYSTGSQTAIAMPLAVGLVEEKDRAVVVQSLVQSIHKSDNALTAGDVGFHFLVSALAGSGQGELLYRMNARDDVPGYGFQLKKGATTLTESWPALENVSNNHLMLGHLMEWFYNGLAGIGQTDNSSACKEICIRPQVPSGIESAGAVYQSPYGTIVSGWKNSAEQFVLNVDIPANTSALVTLPATENAEIMEGNKPLKQARGIIFVNHADSTVTVKTGSGKYRFEVKK